MLRSVCAKVKTAVFETYMKTAADIVSAYVSHNSIRSDDMLNLIKEVHARITELAEGLPEPIEPAKPKPLMPWKKTIHDDYLVSLEDGHHYKTLKRHLSTRGMTITEYREKWGLPDDYPTTARSYSEKRSELAHSYGLGRKSAETTELQSRPEPAPEAAAPPAPKKGRPHPKNVQTRKRNSTKTGENNA